MTVENAASPSIASTEAPVAATAETSCLLVTTPWGGGQRLARYLTTAGAIGSSSDLFNPLRVPTRMSEWGICVDEPRPSTRYLERALIEGTGPRGVFSALVLWTDHRWLVRLGRANLPSEWEGTDAAVVERWLPRPRYLYVRCRDLQRQAVRWQAGIAQPPDGAATLNDGLPDYQQIRWKEDLLERQQIAWQTYFLFHDINAMEVTLEDLVEHPGQVVRDVVGWLGFDPPVSVAPIPPPYEPDGWLDRYLTVRDRLAPSIAPR